MLVITIVRAHDVRIDIPKSDEAKLWTPKFHRGHIGPQWFSIPIGQPSKSR